MRKVWLIISVISVISVSMLTGCFYTGPCLQGYGPVITEIREVDGFTQVVNTGSFEVRVSHADSFYVEVSAQENLMSIIETYVSGDALKIRTRNGTCFNSNAPVVVSVTLPVLEGIRNTGSGELLADVADVNYFECTNTGSGLVVMDSVFAIESFVENTGSGKIYLEGSYVSEMRVRQTGSGYVEVGDVFDSNQFEVEHSSSGRVYAALFNADVVEAKLTGSGRIEMMGDAVDASYRLTSSGKIDALDLVAANVVASTSGSGKIFLHATDNLDVTITGSGDVIYLGNPVISVKITGSGDLNPYRD
jgi:hypothetical protein